MKLPFSYKQNLFKPILGLSVLAHGMLFLHLNLFSPAPQYGVEHAPSSVEVVMIEESEIKPVEDLERAMTTKEPEKETPTVAQKEEIKEKPEVKKSVYVPPVHGAVNEAKPDYLKNDAPPYPMVARQRGWEGLVLLSVVVDKYGMPIRVTVDQSSGFEVLDEAALKTVKKWVFEPAHIGGVSLQSEVKIPIRFLLNE